MTAQNVEPLRNRVRDMEKAQQKATRELADLKALLETLNADLAQLNSALTAANAELSELQLQASIMEKRLTAASKLIAGLTGERDRWTGDVAALTLSGERLLGDCLLSSSFLSYLGAFTADYRKVRLRGESTMRCCCKLSHVSHVYLRLSWKGSCFLMHKAVESRSLAPVP